MHNEISFAGTAYILCVCIYDLLLNVIGYVRMTHAACNAVDAAKALFMATRDAIRRCTRRPLFMRVVQLPGAQAWKS